MIAKEAEFSSYGGYNHVNLGTCRECAAKKANEDILIVTKSGGESKVTQVKCDESVCPECGGKMIKKIGRYGTFVGCSNYPQCRYTQKNKKYYEFN